jgi:hypothetical protein
MWIFSQMGFISIVRHTGKPNLLLVRSRFKGHIEKMFPKARVEEDGERDYRFRAELPAMEVSKVIGEMVLRIKYDNFKGSLDFFDREYLGCCIDVYNSVLMNSDWQ